MGVTRCKILVYHFCSNVFVHKSNLRLCLFSYSGDRFFNRYELLIECPRKVTTRCFQYSQWCCVDLCLVFLMFCLFFFPFPVLFDSCWMCRWLIGKILMGPGRSRYFLVASCSLFIRNWGLLCVYFWVIALLLFSICMWIPCIGLSFPFLY